MRNTPLDMSQLSKKEPELAPLADYLQVTQAPTPPSSQEHPLLRKNLLRYTARQIFFEKALLEVNHALQKAGIEFMVLKGMALAYLVYPDPATRPMVDIDLLIRPKDIRSATEALTALRYHPLGQYQAYTEELIRFGGELVLQRQEGPLVELHWMLEQYERLRGLIRIDEEKLWERAMPYTVSDVLLKTPAPEDQLLTLSIHYGLVHRVEGLKWLLDIDRLIRTFQDQIDWACVMKRAEAWGVRRLLSHILWLSHKTFETPLPSGVTPRPVWVAHTPFSQFAFLDRGQDRLEMLKRILFPSADWLRFRYRLKGRQSVTPYRILHPFGVLTRRVK